MLVLTRKVGEGITIGDDVKIIVMQVMRKQVRLGIKASPSTPVHREEVFQRILEENKRASQTDSMDVFEVKELLQQTDSDSQMKPKLKGINIRRRDED